MENLSWENLSEQEKNCVMEGLIVRMDVRSVFEEYSVQEKGEIFSDVWGELTNEDKIEIMDTFYEVEQENEIFCKMPSVKRLKTQLITKTFIINELRTARLTSRYKNKIYFL